MKVELDLKSLVRTIPDYPKPGIMFRDVTTLLKDAAGFKPASNGWSSLIAPLASKRSSPSRRAASFWAARWRTGSGTGFVPVRKKGKLPWRAIGQEYELEYGTDIIEVHDDAIRPGERILIVDDLIATGGTAEGGLQAHPARGRHSRGRRFRHRSA